MKLTRTLKVSEAEFYDYLECELLTTIYQCSAKELSANDIKKGLNYSKNEDNTNARIDVTILEYQRGSVYKANIKSLTDNIILSYETKVENDGLTVVFHQYIDSFERKKHNRFMHFFSEGVYLGRMSDMIYGIQKKIITQREAQQA